jgi:hypothetical protein
LKAVAVVRVEVTAPTWIFFDGSRYEHGDVFEAPDEAARKWVAAGWVEVVDEEQAERLGLAPNRPGRDLRATDVADEQRSP